MIEVAALATTLVGSILVPFIKQGAQALLSKVQENATDAAANGLVARASKLWDRVRGKASGTPDAAIVDVFAKQPEKMQSSMIEIVKDMLEHDSSFRQEISDLVEGPNGQVAEQWNVFGGTVGQLRADQIHGGYNAGVMINQPAEEQPLPRT